MCGQHPPPHGDKPCRPLARHQAGPDAVLGRTIWAILGLGAFGFQLKEAPAGKHIVTTTRSHSNQLVMDCVSAMNPDAVLRVGGAGNKVGMPRGRGQELGGFLKLRELQRGDRRLLLATESTFQQHLSCKRCKTQVFFT